MIKDHVWGYDKKDKNWDKDDKNCDKEDKYWN